VLFESVFMLNIVRACCREQFGSFTYAPHRTPFDPKDPYLKVNFSSTGMNSRMLSSSRSHFGGFRRRQKPTISVVKNTAIENSADRPPVKMILKLPSADKHASIATETARAVKLKYSSIISTRRVSGTSPTKRIEPTLAMSVTEESFDNGSADVETQDNIGSGTGGDEVEEESDGEGKSCCEEDHMNEGNDDSSDNSVLVAVVGDLPAVGSSTETKPLNHSVNEYTKDKVDERNGQGITKELRSCSGLDDSAQTQKAEASEERSNDELAADKSQVKDGRFENNVVNANSLSTFNQPSRSTCLTLRSVDADNLKSFSISLSRSDVPQSVGSSMHSRCSGNISPKTCDAVIVNQSASSPRDKVNRSQISTQAELLNTAIEREAVSKSDNESHFENSLKVDDGGCSKESLIIGTITCGTDLDLDQDSVPELLAASNNSSKSQTSAAPTSSHQKVSILPPRLSSPECRALESLPSNETSSSTPTSTTRDSEWCASSRPGSANIAASSASAVLVQSSASSDSNSLIEPSSKVISAQTVMSRDVASSVTSSAVPAVPLTPCETALISSSSPMTSAKTVAATVTRALTTGTLLIERFVLLGSFVYVMGGQEQPCWPPIVLADSVEPDGYGEGSHQGCDRLFTMTWDM